MRKRSLALVILLVAGCSRAEERATTWRTKADEAMTTAYRVQGESERWRALAERWERIAIQNQESATSLIATTRRWERMWADHRVSHHGYYGSASGGGGITTGLMHFDANCNLVLGVGSGDDPPDRCGLAAIQSDINYISADVNGRVLAACIDGPKTDSEFLAYLRSLPPDALGVVAYVDGNGDAQVLTSDMLSEPKP